MVFPGVAGNTLNVLTEMYQTWLSGSSLSVCALLPCVSFSITSSPSLPLYPWVGLTFCKKAHYLYSALIPPTAHIYSMESLQIFLFVVWVPVFVFPLGILGWSLGQRLRWNSWAFSSAGCGTWYPGGGFGYILLWLAGDTLSRVLIDCLSYS